MSTIKEIKGWPVGTIIPNLSATAKVVFQRKTGEGQYGPWSVQGVVLADETGDEIQASCWGFDDLSYIKGQTVAVASTGKNHKTGKTQGVELVEGKGKDGTARLELKVGHKTGGFIGGSTPSPESTKPMASQTAIPAIPSHSAPQPVSGASRIEGVTVGMAINKAVDLAITSGETSDDNIWKKASMLIRLSAKLQAGQLAPESPVETEEIPY